MSRQYLRLTAWQVSSAALVVPLADVESVRTLYRRTSHLGILHRFEPFLPLSDHLHLDTDQTRDIQLFHEMDHVPVSVRAGLFMELHTVAPVDVNADCEHDYPF